jgi:membrane-associated phospholipid phosphatase
MNALDIVMRYYPYVFHPAVMVGGMMLTLIYLEYDRQGASGDVLKKRLGVFALVGATSLLPTFAYMLVTGQGPVETMQGNAWQVDFLVGSGMALVAAVMWLVWHRFDWGSLIPPAMEALVVVTVPYVALSPLWNVSGHVIFSVMPTLYLVLVERRFWPLLLIPAVMVPNRLYVGAHGLSQAVAGLLIAAVLVIAVYELREEETRTPPTEAEGVRG